MINFIKKQNSTENLNLNLLVCYSLVYNKKREITKKKRIKHKKRNAFLK